MSSALTVLSLGGSLVAPPTGINTEFLSSLRVLLEKRIANGEKFIIVVGGGAPARAYMDAAQQLVTPTTDELDWIGIYATRLNAVLMRTVLKEFAPEDICTDPSVHREWTGSVLVASGWKPGWSTDYVAVCLADTYGAQRVINLTNVERVYDKDPREHADAMPFDSMTWAQLREIVGNEWKPGANAPFDPIASRLADEKGKTVVVAKGSDLENLEKILNNEPFFGTTIQG